MEEKEMEEIAREITDKFKKKSCFGRIWDEHDSADLIDIIMSALEKRKDAWGGNRTRTKSKSSNDIS